MKTSLANVPKAKRSGSFVKKCSFDDYDDDTEDRSLIGNQALTGFDDDEDVPESVDGRDVSTVLAFCLIIVSLFLSHQ
jgi:hypothetical protein